MDKYRVYSQAGRNCNYCQKATQLLRSLNDVSYDSIPLEKEELLVVADQAKMNTVPIIYYNDQLIGGYDDLVQHLENNYFGKPSLLMFQKFQEKRGYAQCDTLPVKKLTEKAQIPTYGSDGAAGLDLYADLSAYTEDKLRLEITRDGNDIGTARTLVIPAGEQRLVKTGIAMKLPRGTYGRIAPRSGLAFKASLDIMAGVIDEDYRGELGVIVRNHGDEDFVVEQGTRIAQLIVEKYIPVLAYNVKDLDDSDRGEGGFGSTGV